MTFIMVLYGQKQLFCIVDVYALLNRYIIKNEYQIEDSQIFGYL